MAGYKCEKCGETAYSKCVASRNVFPGDQLATCIGNMFHYEANRKWAGNEKARESDSSTWTLKIEMTIYNAMSEQDAWQEFVKIVTETRQDLLKKALCDHRWELQDDKCDLGCCNKTR